MKKIFNEKKFKFILGDINNEPQLRFINQKYKIDLIFHTSLQTFEYSRK